MVRTNIQRPKWSLLLLHQHARKLYHFNQTHPNHDGIDHVIYHTFSLRKNPSSRNARNQSDNTARKRPSINHRQRRLCSFDTNVSTMPHSLLLLTLQFSFKPPPSQRRPPHRLRTLAMTSTQRKHSHTEPTARSPRRKTPTPLSSARSPTNAVPFGNETDADMPRVSIPTQNADPTDSESSDEGSIVAGAPAIGQFFVHEAPAAPDSIECQNEEALTVVSSTPLPVPTKMRGSSKSDDVEAARDDPPSTGETVNAEHDAPPASKPANDTRGAPPVETPAVSADDDTSTRDNFSAPVSLAIQDLHPFLDDNWILPARVVACGEPIAWSTDRSQGKRLSVHIIDRNGDMIKATIFNDAISTFLPMLIPGACCSFAGGNIRFANRAFSRDPHDLNFDGRSAVARIPELSVPSTPIRLCNTVDEISRLPSKSVVTALGIVARVGSEKRIATRKGTETSKRELLIVDQSAAQIVCILWGAHAKDDLSGFVQKPVLIRHADINDYNDSRSLNAGPHTAILFDPALPGTEELKVWYDEIAPRLEIKYVRPPASA